jgi:osmotically-inducible protein OsmY
MKGAVMKIGLMSTMGAGLFALACSNTVEGLKKDAKENKVEERAEKAAEVVTEAVKEAGHEISEKTLAMQIKATLMADQRVDAGDLTVKGDDDRKVLTLEGSVPTARQKDLAEQVARQKAGGYRVENRLVVAGR